MGIRDRGIASALLLYASQGCPSVYKMVDSSDTEVSLSEELFYAQTTTDSKLRRKEEVQVGATY